MKRRRRVNSLISSMASFELQTSGKIAEFGCARQRTASSSTSAESSRLESERASQAQNREERPEFFTQPSSKEKSSRHLFISKAVVDQTIYSCTWQKLFRLTFPPALGPRMNGFVPRIDFQRSAEIPSIPITLSAGRSANGHSHSAHQHSESEAG